MQRLPSAHRKLKLVAESCGIPHRKPSAEPLHRTANKQVIRDSTSAQSQHNQQTNNHEQVKLPQLRNSDAVERENDQPYENQFMVDHAKEVKRSKQAQIQSFGQNKQHFKELGRKRVESFKKQLINRDRCDHPFKYKIVQEQLGLNPQKIYQLKVAELSQIQQQYQKHKGVQYLREGRSKVNGTRLKTETPSYSRTRTNSQKLFSQALVDLQEKEDILGKIVYQRVKRHLKQEKVSRDFTQRVHSQEAIDCALIDFLKLKIQRAQTSLKHI